MFKKIIFSLSLVLFSLPFFWFAWDEDWYCKWNTDWAGEKLPICYNSPKVVNKYLQDMVYIMSLVSSKKSNSSWLWALWKKALDTGLWSLGVATMFASNGVWNLFQNFLIIFKEPDVVRDRVKITNFQQYITDKTLKIASKWMLNQNIKDLTKIKNYIRWNDSFIISFDWTTYKELFIYLWKNQLFFEKIYYDKIVSKENISFIENSIVSNIIKNNSNFVVNSNSLMSLDQKFNVYKTECNTSWADFQADLKHVICSVWWKKLKKANKRFTCNYSRLEKALFGIWSGWNCWSVKLVEKAKSWSERFKSKVKVEWIWTLSYWNKDIKNWWNPDTASLNQMSKDIKKYSWLWNWIKEIWNNYANMFDYTEIWMNVSLDDYAVKKQENFINSNLQAVIQDENTVWVDLAWVEAGKATHNITLLFPQISQQIDKIRQKIWKSVSENGTIYKNIEKTCQNQSPQKWNCSY